MSKCTDRMTRSAGVFASVVGLALAVVAPAQTIPPIWEPNFGSVVPGGAQSDDSTSPISFGFSFPFQGSSYTTATLSSNGFLQLGGSNGALCCNGNVSTFLSGFPMIAPAWFDLYPPGRGAVKLNTFPGRAVITWDDVPGFCCTGVGNTFQMQLFSSGQIIFGYVQFNSSTVTGHNVLIGVTPGGGAANPGSTNYLTSLPVSTGCVGTSYDFLTGFGEDVASTSKTIPSSGKGTNPLLAYDFQGINIVFTPSGCNGWNINGTAGCNTHMHGHTFLFGHANPAAHFFGHHTGDPRHGHHFLCANHAFGHTPYIGAHLQPEAGEEMANPGFVAGLNQDGSPNGAKAAARGTVLQLFGSAAGIFLGAEDDEESAVNFTPPASGSPLYSTTSLPQVRIGGVAAKVLFSGLAPGLTGVWQINVQIPEEARAGKAPVTISYEGYELRSVDIAIE